MWMGSIMRGFFAETGISPSAESYTAIPRGAETRYFAFDYGIRRNFVPPRSRIAPFFDMRGGIGDINAKGPDGVLYAQGQNMTFTLMLGSDARYNFSPRTSLEAGAEYMHVSNAYLSQPRYEDFGIKRLGPVRGIQHADWETETAQRPLAPAPDSPPGPTFRMARQHTNSEQVSPQTVLTDAIPTSLYDGPPRIPAIDGRKTRARAALYDRISGNRGESWILNLLVTPFQAS